MRLFFLGILWILFSATASGQKGPLTDIELEDVRTMAMVESKNILVSFGSGSSVDSQDLDALLLDNKSINEVIQESLISVSVDMDNVNDFKWFADFRIVYVPTLAIINPLGEEVDRIAGNITKDRVHTFFKRFKEVDPTIFLVEEPSIVAVTAPVELDKAIISEPIEVIVEDEKISETQLVHSEINQDKIELAHIDKRETNTEIVAVVSTTINTTANTTSTGNIIAASEYKSAYRATINRTPIEEEIVEDYTPNYRVVYASEGADFPLVTLSTTSKKSSVKKANKRKSTSQIKSTKKLPNNNISSSIKTTSIFNLEFRIHFGTYDTMVIAQNQTELLKKSIHKEIQIVEENSEYKVISRDLESRSEARSFVKESRAQGINCFLLNG